MFPDIALELKNHNNIQLTLMKVIIFFEKLSFVKVDLVLIAL